MKLDIKKWNELRKELEAKIKATKHSIRYLEKPVMVWGKVGVHEEGRRKGQDKWDFVPSDKVYRGGTSNEYISLEEMKQKVTCLYAVRAAYRNRLHCSKWTIEEVKEIFLPLYSFEEKLEDPIIS
jgi:hypothetical protein